MEALPKVTRAELLEQIKSGKYMLFFSADWCPDCRFIKPAMPEIEAEYSDFTFLAVDRDENIDLAAELNIFGIPSFIAYQDGKELGRFVNKDRKTKVEVEKFINELPVTTK
ncbi:thioredoxin family protein [Loigolactobacillus iwatensis]|uniref:thioredoxin family protein n=1 Tax=Loigolactobacillus iwatensis TaxID=1267156 RepID=UPI000F7E206F|nr:thioredoxin family protein [Loigolactobacillus iwatensis]